LVRGQNGGSSIYVPGKRVRFLNDSRGAVERYSSRKTGGKDREGEEMEKKWGHDLPKKKKSSHNLDGSQFVPRLPKGLGVLF